MLFDHVWSRIMTTLYVRTYWLKTTMFMSCIWPDLAIHLFWRHVILKPWGTSDTDAVRMGCLSKKKLTPFFPKSESKLSPKSNVGWWYTYPSEKYESQLGWLFPIYGKIKAMFQSPPIRFDWYWAFRILQHLAAMWQSGSAPTSSASCTEWSAKVTVARSASSSARRERMLTSWAWFVRAEKCWKKTTA